MQPHREEHPQAAPSRQARWVEIVEAAGAALATTLEAAMAGQCLREGYPRWLALEGAVCRISAQALEGVAAWHATAPALHSAAIDWAAEIRDRARRAEAEARAHRDGTVVPAALDAWRRFAATAASSTQAGEALGTVLLHERLMQGIARHAVGAAAHCMGTGSDYLRRRTQPERDIDRAARDALLGAYSATALAAGARRAGLWYQVAITGAMQPQAH